MDIFTNYLKKFDIKDEMIISKYNHSLRVEILCEMIAKNLKLSKREIELAKLCGLYHDIGRFIQAKDYETFWDLDSIDHGDLGYQIFNEEIAKELKLPKKDISIIGKCIKYHNKYSFGDLKNEELFFVKIIRDADKIDILYQNAYVKKKIETDSNSLLSDECIKSFDNKTQINNELVRNINDKLLVVLAFIWDINYDYTFSMIKSNDYYNKIKKKVKCNLFDKYFAQIDLVLEEK